jgi:hypothetical protein
MLTDDQLAESIGARLHAEVADIGSPPDLLTTLRRRQARRTLAVRAGLTASLAATAATIAFATAGAGPPQSTPEATSPARIETVAYVTGKADAALAHADQFLERTETASDGYRFVAWYDTATSRYRANAYHDGRPDHDVAISVTPSGVGTVLVVDHPSRSWWRYEKPGRPTTSSGGKRLADPLDPESIRAAISAGNLEILGHDQVDGRDTLHLRWTPPRKPVPSPMDLWVDATSYLPCRMTMGTATTTFAWLPRTAENLTNLDLVPPAGYTQRPDPAAYGHRPGNG